MQHWPSSFHGRGDNRLSHAPWTHIFNVIHVHSACVQNAQIFLPCVRDWKQFDMLLFQLQNPKLILDHLIIRKTKLSFKSFILFTFLVSVTQAIMMLIPWVLGKPGEKLENFTFFATSQNRDLPSYRDQYSLKMSTTILFPHYQYFVW